jgi:hypothetical protein
MALGSIFSRECKIVVKVLEGAMFEVCFLFPVKNLPRIRDIN